MSSEANWSFEATISASYTAKFRARLEDEIVITLNKDPEDITALKVKGGGVYKVGDTVRIEAIGNEDYIFKGWYEGTLFNKNSVAIFKAERDRTFTAKWEKSTNPYDKGGTSGQEGGGGSYDYNTDKIPYISGEDNSADIGFFTIYTLTKDKLKALAYKLINADLGTKFAQLFNKPMDAIMGLYLTKAPILTETATTCKIGTWDSEISCNMLVNQWNTKDMGSITINEYYGNDLDYSKTSLEIWLPYIGFKQLDTTELMGKTINVKYKFNQLNGDCVACILVDNSIRYQYEGNVFVELPYSAENSNAIKLVAGAAVGIGGAVATVLTGGAATAAMGALGGAALSLLNYNDSMSHGGSVGNSAKFLEVQYPVLFIKRPKLNIPEDIAKYKGLPSNITAQVGTLSGYTKLRDIHLDGLNLDDDEIQELEDILTNGFIIR